MLLAPFTSNSIAFRTYILFITTLIWTFTSTGVIAATIRARQLNETTNALAGGKAVAPAPVQEPLLEDSLLTADGLSPYLQPSKDEGVIAGSSDWSPIHVEWEASGDDLPNAPDETELTTEVVASERVNEPDPIESRMDDDDDGGGGVIESRTDDDASAESVAIAQEDAAESRMDTDDAEELAPVTTPEPIAAQVAPVRFTQKPVRPVATNSLLMAPPPPPSPPVFTELRPFNPVMPLKNNVWDVRVSTHTLTKPIAPPGVLNAPATIMADERLDYDYSGEELPPSLPNLDIIPFVAADAVVGVPSNLEEDERLIHKTMRDDLVASKRPAAVVPGEQLNEKAPGSPARPVEEAPGTENRRNLWLINGTHAPVSGKFNQSNEALPAPPPPAAPQTPQASQASLARNSAEQQQHQQPKKPAKPSPLAASKFPILVPRPSIPLPPPPSPPRKTIDGSTKAPSAGFGSLRVESCNIYGQMYFVGKIIPELSGPCSECKCTEIGVNCFNLKC